MVTLCREKVLNAGQWQARSAGDGQGNRARGGVLELALQGHRGEAIPPGRNGLSKKAESEHSALRAGLQGGCRKSMGSQVSAGLEFKPRWVGTGANAAVLGCRRTFIRILHCRGPWRVVWVWKSVVTAKSSSSKAEVSVHEDLLALVSIETCLLDPRAKISRTFSSHSQ